MALSEKEVRRSPFLQAGVSRVLHGDGQDGGDDGAADESVQGQSHHDTQTGFRHFNSLFFWSKEQHNSLVLNSELMSFQTLVLQTSVPNVTG